VTAPRRFALAPMQTWLRVLTLAVLAMPVVLFVAAWTSPRPVAQVLAAAAIFTVLVYASVWLVWRPTRFEVDDAELRIVWPLRSRRIPRAQVEGVARVTGREFRREHGWGMRIGAGGLGGGFGLLKTAGTTFSMWISRTDEFVVVRLRDARPLLITPETPERFVEALRPLAR